MKRITLVLIAVLLITAVLSAGCVTNVSPSPSPTYSTPDYTAYLAKYYGNASTFRGLSNDSVTTVKPLSRTGDRTYSGEYNVTINGTTQTHRVQLELLTSKEAAVMRYAKIVLQNLYSGYNASSVTQLNAKKGEATKLTKSLGSDVSNVYVIYSHNTELDEWVVQTNTPLDTATTSRPQLSQAQLNAIQRDVEAKGYNITQPLKQSGGIGASANGSTLYKGAITQNPIQYSLTVEVYKDNATANSQFSLTVRNLQKSGIVGSYNSPTQWAGVTTLNGIQVSSSVTKSATGPPYTITTIE